MNCLIIKEKPEITEERKAFYKMKRDFRTAKIIIWSFFTGYIFGVTPMVFQYADAQRPFGGIGGEIFFPILPVLCYPVFNGLCNLIWGRMVKTWQQKRRLKTM